MTKVSIAESKPWGGKALPGQDELPCDDGEPMETAFHVAQMNLLIDSLLDAWPERNDFHIGGNNFVYFSEHQIKRNDFRGPDVFVVLDTQRKPRKSWVAWDEGGRLPDVVIEVTSESTEAVDRGEKKRIYARNWRTPAYFIFDPETGELEGYRLDVDRLEYAPIAPDRRGDFPLPQLGLSIGLRPTRYRDYDRAFVRWIDSAGEALPIPTERAEQARARADEERARADEERARADEERARADQAEERLQSLEARLAQANRPPDDRAR